MRAVVLSEFGPPAVLVPTEVPDPAPGPGQVVVDVELAGITFVETHVRAGRAPNPAMAPALPGILGNGVGGVMAAVGPGLDPALAGTRVVTSTGGSGGYAERVAVDAAGVIAVPDGLALRDAVALLADGRTAIALMRAATVREGRELRWPKASSRRVASAAGARVVAAAGGTRKLEVARRLGADATVDYSEPGWAALVGPADVAFDGVGGEIGRAAFELVRPGGRFSAFGLASGTFAQVSDEQAEQRGVAVLRGARLSPDAILELARTALAEAAAGRLRPVIGQTFPLERAADAHAAIESRATVGKTLLVVRE